MLLIGVRFFGEKADSFLEYTSYFINYPKASKTLEKKKDKEPFASILKECESHSELNKLPLNSYLIKPVQRVTKYSLLLKVSTLLFSLLFAFLIF